MNCTLTKGQLAQRARRERERVERLSNTRLMVERPPNAGSMVERPPKFKRPLIQSEAMTNLPRTFLTTSSTSSEIICKRYKKAQDDITRDSLGQTPQSSNICGSFGTIVQSLGK